MGVLIVMGVPVAVGVSMGVPVVMGPEGEALVRSPDAATVGRQT